MLHEIAKEIHSPTNAALLARVISLLRCTSCGASRFEIHRDESTPLDIQTHCVVVCEECKTCFKYENGILEMLTERPSGLSLAQRSNFTDMVADYYQSAWRSWCMHLFCGKKFDNEAESKQLIDLLRFNELPQNPVFVDVGTSHGYYAISVAGKLKETHPEGYVIGIDFSKKMLYRAVAAAEKAAVSDRILWILADAEDMPFSGGCADRVTCGGGLNEYGHPQKVISECARVVSENSLYVTMNLFSKGAFSKFLFFITRLISGLLFLTRDSWNRMLEEAGFHQREQRICGVVMFTVSQK